MKTFEGGSASNNPVYIGIDQSYSGFAITALNATGYRTTVFNSELRGVDRLLDIQNHLEYTLGNYPEINDVAIEGYAFGSQMSNMLGELGGLVKVTLRRYNFYPLIIPPTTLKKYVTGKGTGVPKSQMVLHVYKKWDAEFSDDNAADSYALARLASGYANLAYEKEICNKVKDPSYRER